MSYTILFLTMILSRFLILSVPFPQEAGAFRTHEREKPSRADFTDNGRRDLQQLKSQGDEGNLEIFLLIGQSNMAGRADLDPFGKDTLERVFLYAGEEEKKWEK